LTPLTNYIQVNLSIKVWGVQLSILTQGGNGGFQFLITLINQIVLLTVLDCEADEIVLLILNRMIFILD
ncbi:MAG: hypothetical protein ACRC1W_00450, partial [Shewanella sp.]